MPMKYTIIGIDSGKTVAVVSMSLDREVIGIDTGRFAGLDWFVDRIREKGMPVVIASDKKDAQSLVRRLAAIFNSVIFTPNADINVERKQELAQGYKVGNLHERDALSAAIVAYNSYVSKLKQAERAAREQNFGDVDRMKMLVIKRYSIHEALKEEKKVHRFVRG
ncbi:MAG: DUF460 domain-containing protein [Candidatus Micrarchaeota archaeon]|nr:DUF460 domain-containing protein [Candidatus Micrarchaeota archaeon]